MWNFMWLDIDSSLQTNDSKWLDSFCDSILTRLDQVMTLTRLEKILDDSDSTRKNFRWLWLDSESKGLWLLLDKNDSVTSLLDIEQ